MSEHGLRPRPQRGELPGRYTGPTLANPCGNAGRENTTVAGADLLSFHPVTKRASRLPQAASRQRDSSSPGSPSRNPQQMLRELVPELRLHRSDGFKLFANECKALAVLTPTMMLFVNMNHQLGLRHES